MIPIYRALDEIPHVFGACVAAIGNFDGVHCGHREILRAVLAEARERGLRAIAITFDPHPEKLLRPDNAPQLLTTIPERVQLLGGTGMDAVVVLPFTRALAALSAREFVRKVLVDALAVRGLHEGANFRFGHRAEGGIEELRAFGAEFGFGVTVHEAVHVHGLEVSSSAVRDLVATGDMRRARWMLGRPFAVRGTQKRDRGVGTRLLVPTVNLAPDGEVLPANGVYVTRLTVGERCFHAVSNVGDRPTFKGAGFSVETHILDFEPVETGEDAELQLEFLLRLREERQFATVEELKAQIMRDVAKAQRFFRLAV